MRLKVAVVGGCASGKTTLSTGLRHRGVDAWTVAQEHSEIPNLWRHLQPDRLVVLDVTLGSVRLRRNDQAWPGWIWEMQQLRIADARTHADVIIETDAFTPSEVLEMVIDRLGLSGCAVAGMEDYAPIA